MQGILQRRFLLLAAAVLGIGAVAGCGPRHAETVADDGPRIVSFLPSGTETLFALGLGDCVVGRSRFCDFPPEAAALPVVGDLFAANEDALAALRPTHAVLGRADAPQAALLRALGCEIVEGRAETAADVLAFADTLGELFPGRTNGLAVAGSKWREEMEKLSHAESAEAIASARLASGVSRLESHAENAEAFAPARLVDGVSRLESHAESAENAERVLVVVSHAPGRFGAAFAAGEGTYLDEILRAAGFANALAGVSGYPSLDPDRIAALAPDLLIDVHPDGDPPDEDAWSYLPKTRVETLHDTAALRPGPRLPEVLERFRALRR